MEPNEPIIEQRESIKLIRNAKGNYQWEVKVLDLDIEKLNKINEELNKKYGSQNEWKERIWSKCRADTL